MLVKGIKSSMFHSIKAMKMSSLKFAVNILFYIQILQIFKAFFDIFSIQNEIQCTKQLKVQGKHDITSFQRLTVLIFSYQYGEFEYTFHKKMQRKLTTVPNPFQRYEKSDDYSGVQQTGYNYRTGPQMCDIDGRTYVVSIAVVFIVNLLEQCLCKKHTLAK